MLTFHSLLGILDLTTDKDKDQFQHPITDQEFATCVMSGHYCTVGCWQRGHDPLEQILEP